MSELKAFTFGLGQYMEDGTPCVIAFDGEKNPRLASDEKFYIKSEADKVIAEKDKEIDRISEQALDTINWQAKTIRHQKYKRCLLMAKICENKLGTVVKPGWWDTWRRHWLELAEKFKEAK